MKYPKSRNLESAADAAAVTRPDGETFEAPSVASPSVESFSVAPEDAAYIETAGDAPAADTHRTWPNQTRVRPVLPILLSCLCAKDAAALTAEYDRRAGFLSAGATGSVTLRVEYGKNGRKRFVVGSLIDGKAEPPSVFEAAAGEAAE